MSNPTIIGVAILATLGLALPCVRAAEHKAVWLDEMNLSTAISGWGSTQAKKSIEGKPLTLRGKVYERGIGTHAWAGLRVDLEKRGVRFKPSPESMTKWVPQVRSSSG